MIQLSKFAKDVFTLSTGTATAQAITIAITPILTRIYSPAEFGVFVVFSSIVTICAAFSTGRYEFAILSAKNDGDAWQCVWLVIAISIGISFFFLVSGIGVVLLFKGLLNEGYSIPIIFLACITLLVTSVYQALYYWSNRFQQYGRLSTNRVIGSFCVSLLSIILGCLGFGSYGLIIASLGGQALNTSLLLSQILKEEKLRNIPNLYDIKSQGMRYIDYPKYLLLSGVLERFSSQTPVVALSTFFGASASGAMGLYQRVIRVPVNTVGTAISDVFKQRASMELNQKGECKNLFLKTGLWLLLLGFIPFITLLFFAPILFPFIFGAEWQEAGVYARVMSWMFFIGFVVSPLSSMIYIGEKQKYDLIMQIFLLTLIGLSILGGYYYNSALLTVAFFTVSYCLKYVFEFLISYRIANGNFKLFSNISLM